MAGRVDASAAVTLWPPRDHQMAVSTHLSQEAGAPREFSPSVLTERCSGDKRDPLKPGCHVQADWKGHRTVGESDLFVRRANTFRIPEGETFTYLSTKMCSWVMFETHSYFSFLDLGL